MAQLSDIIRAAVQQSGLSVEQIADELKRPPSTLYAQLDTNQRARLDVDDLLTIMRVTGCAAPLRWLLLEWSNHCRGIK